jgi:hypothetical protein
MWEKEQEKQRDELFNKIKPVTLPKQEWKRKNLEALWQELLLGGQTA